MNLKYTTRNINEIRKIKSPRKLQIDKTAKSAKINPYKVYEHNTDVTFLISLPTAIKSPTNNTEIPKNYYLSFSCRNSCVNFHSVCCRRFESRSGLRYPDQGKHPYSRQKCLSMMEHGANELLGLKNFHGGR